MEIEKIQSIAKSLLDAGIKSVIIPSTPEFRKHVKHAFDEAYGKLISVVGSGEDNFMSAMTIKVYGVEFNFINSLKETLDEK